MIGNILGGEQVCRIAFAGDSITWGDGMLDGGFVGDAIAHLHKRYTETKYSYEVTVIGTGERVESRKCLGGSAVRLIGGGSGVSFEWEHESLHLILALERDAPTTVVNLLVDDEVQDSFVLYKDDSHGMDCLRIIGDGSASKYDLGRAFTYEHQVKRNGSLLQGQLFTSGYGQTLPEGDDYMIVRKYGECNDPGMTEVHHFLWLREPLPEGALLEVSYRYGETIAYARTTVGEIGPKLDSPLESRFGEGDVAFDPAHPTSLSSGLDFRATDPRAVRSWHFAGRGTRRISFQIVQGDESEAEQAAMPRFVVNAVTNRLLEVMNAGIGGWTARLFNEDRKLRGLSQLIAWKPDLLFIGLGTNDDWEQGNTFAATRTIRGLSEQAVRKLPVLWLRSCSYEGSDSYNVETSELLIQDLSAHSVTFDQENANFQNIAHGDILVIGDYEGDNRNVQCRMIDSWDETTKTAHFVQPLVPNPITPQLEGYRGQKVRIKRPARFVEELSKMLSSLQEALPTTPIVLLETGLSHFHTRLLTGYPELIKELAAEHGCSVVKLYEPLMQWQYAQERSVRAYLDREGSSTATGEAVYALFGDTGRGIAEQCNYQLRNWSVRVNGEERYGDACRLEGGYMLAFAPEVAPEELTFTDWQARSRHPKMAVRPMPMQLVFTDRIPPAGAQIEVVVSADKWSADDAHLNLPGGMEIYARQVNQMLDAYMQATPKQRRDGTWHAM